MLKNYVFAGNLNNKNSEKKILIYFHVKILKCVF